MGPRKGLATQVRAKPPPKQLTKRRRPPKSNLAPRVWPWTDWSWNLFGVSAAEARRKQPAKEAAEALPEDAVGQAVDETVTEAVANCQPRCEEGSHLVMVQPSTLQNKIEDIGHPQHVKDAGDAEQHHGIAFVWTTFTALPSLPFVTLRLRVEASVTLGDLPRVLPTDLEYTTVGEADGERSRCVKKPHNESAEPRVGLPGVGAPLEDVPVVSWFAPAKERRQKDHRRVKPDEHNAHS